MDIALRGGQVYHIEGIPVILHDTYTKVSLPTIDAPRDTKAARKDILFSKELRATTNKWLHRRWGSMSSQWHWPFSTQMICGRRSINEECLQPPLTDYFLNKWEEEIEVPTITSTSITNGGILFLKAYQHCLSRRHNLSVQWNATWTIPHKEYYMHHNTHVMHLRSLF
jgi:hypothetical protein